MSLSILVACLATLAFPQAAATPQQLSQEDRDNAIGHLQKTQRVFLQSIDGLSEAQWKYKPAPDRWSIAEVAEHIAVSEGTILQLITTKIVSAPPAPAGAPRLTDRQVIERITDRSQKAQAPEFLQPTNRWSNREALTKDFETARQQTIDYVKTTKDDLRGHAADSPLGAPLDGYQWILLLSAHSARHTAQIEEVKGTEGFPKR